MCTSPHHIQHIAIVVIKSLKIRREKVHPFRNAQKELAEAQLLRTLFFFKFKFIYFNCRLITVQYCIGFAIHQHESTTGVHAFPNMTPSHLSGSSPCTSPKHAVSCTEHRLVINFLHDSIHDSMLFSQNIQPSPSPTESKRLLYTSVSLLLSRIQG